MEAGKQPREPTPAEANGYHYVLVGDWWWPTLAGRWHMCPKCERLLAYPEFAYGSSGICSWCRPDALPWVPRKRATKEKK